MNNLKFISFVLSNCIFFYILEDLWNLQRKLGKDYYPIYKLWCGPIAFVSIHHPDDVEVKETLENELIFILRNSC